MLWNRFLLSMKFEAIDVIEVDGGWKKMEKAFVDLVCFVIGDIL